MADQSSHASHDSAHLPAPSDGDSLRAEADQAAGAAQASRRSGGSSMILERPAGSGSDAGSAANGVEQAGGSSAREVLLSPEAQKTVISRNRPEGSSATPPPANPLEMAVMLEGQRLDHFELGQFVGGGGMGAVFRATDTMLDRTVAVKILSRHQTDDEIIRRFKNEAQSAARLDHPNIARVYYVGEDQGWNYIVFEFIEGVNIRDLVESKGPLSLEEAFSYTLQVAEALEHACHRDVVHRDIKPSNVLIMPDGHAKLVDMGLARLHQVEAGNDDLTASGVTLGTFDYISPEQARDPRSADVRSDIYSLGCTLYFMLTGRPPFAGTAIKKLLSHASDAPPNLRQFRPEVPDEVSALVNRMMAKRPGDRYQRPSELIGELLLLADQLGLTGATRGGTVWITQQRSSLSRLAPWLVTLAALLLLAIGIVVFDHLTSGRTDAAANVTDARKIELGPPVEPPPVAPSGEPNVADGGAKVVDNTTNAGTSSDMAVQPMPPNERVDTEGPGSPPPTDVGSPAPSVFAELFALDPDTFTVNDDSATLDLRPTVDEIGFLSGSSDDSAALVSAAQTPPGAEAPLPTTVVVGLRTEEPLPPLAIALPSLEQALKYAAETATVSTIEIASGVYELPPLTLAFKRPESSDETLTIRARSESAPVLLFRPRADDVDVQSHMIRIVGGRHVNWDRVHFWFELPEEVATTRWSLFQLQNLASLTFDNCTMTLHNADALDRRLHDKAAFISVEPPLVDEARDNNNMAPLFMRLQSCIARGQAALVRAETATPFALDWTEGLFVSSEPMVVAGGRAEEPGESDRIEVDLHNVTAVLPQGLCRLETELDKKYQLILDVNCEQNIFVTDASVPFLDRQGPESLDDAARNKLLFVDKESFFSPQAPIFCRLGSDEGETREFRFRDAGDTFMSVKPPKEFVMWGGTADTSLDSPAHTRKKEHFLLSDTPQGARTSGFNPINLPSVPLNPLKAPPAPPMPPMPPMPPAVEGNGEGIGSGGE